MARVKGGEIVSGRLGGRVYRDLGGEEFVSAAPAVVNPRTPAQTEARARLALAVRLWRELPMDAMDRWRAWAEGAVRFDPATGRRRSARGDLAFRGLAAKYLQVHGGSTVPDEPPASPFLGDGLGVTVSGVETGVVFSASAPNAEGVLTELLLQPLAARYRKPHPEEYRTKRFVAFASESLSATVEVPPGAYACAIRFVREATGQETMLLPVGTVEVG